VARKRMIHPSFFLSQTMNDVPVTTMVTFAGIWCWADDFGRGEDDAALVKAAVWARRKAMTEAKVAAAIDELVYDGALCRYIVGGVPLLHVTHWNEHQKVSHPTPSKLPPCPIHEPDAHEAFRSGVGAGMERFRRISRDAPESFSPSVVKSSSVQFRSDKDEGETSSSSSPSNARARGLGVVR
jgi:hypothetical protein